MSFIKDLWKSPMTWPNTTYNTIKCATRKYTVLYLFGYFVIINLLHLWLWNHEWIVWQDHNITREFLILSAITLIIMISLYLWNLESIHKELTSTIKKLIEKIRSLSPENPWQHLSIQSLHCDDELQEVVNAINTKSSQIQDYIDHLNLLIGYLWHEMNTPLAIIKLSLERIKKDDQDNDSHIALIEDEIQQMSSLITMIGSLVSSTTIQESYKTIDLNTVLWDTINEFKILYPNTSIKFTSISTDTIKSHKIYLTTIFRNLIENWIVHWWSSIEVIRWEGIIQIQDHGKWIGTPELRKIRMPFWKKDQSRSKVGSYGLWLTLVKQLIDTLWRKIEVTSDTWWTTFTLTREH